MPPGLRSLLLRHPRRDARGAPNARTHSACHALPTGGWGVRARGVPPPRRGLPLPEGQPVSLLRCSPLPMHRISHHGTRRFPSPGQCLPELPRGGLRRTRTCYPVSRGLRPSGPRRGTSACTHRVRKGTDRRVDRKPSPAGERADSDHGTGRSMGRSGTSPAAASGRASVPRFRRLPRHPTAIGGGGDREPAAVLRGGNRHRRPRGS